ncbi:MAG: hypothetical protein ACHQAY_17960 [Hyphomicrobiales bacterium]
MKRREFVGLIGGAAAAWPLVARAATRDAGNRFLGSSSLDNSAPVVTAFPQGLKETGYVEGRTWRSNFARRIRQGEKAGREK